MGKYQPEAWKYLKSYWSSHFVDVDKAYREIRGMLGEHQIRTGIIILVDLNLGCPGNVL